MTTQSVNIRDVAKHAGVSTGTVSRVLSGADGVRPRNEKAVHDAVAALGYELAQRRPLRSGRRRQRRKTATLGFFLPRASSQWAGHPMYVAVFQGIARACEETGYHYITEFGDVHQGVPRMVAEAKIDGLLVKGAAQGRLDQLPQDLPIVGVNQNQPGLPYDQVNCDDYYSGYAATEHLWQQGHRRIAFLSNVSHHPMLLMRYQGLERFLRSHQAFDAALVHLPETRQDGPSVPETSYTAFDDVLSRWMAMPQPPTAVVTANDWNAAGLYQTAARLGVRIPHDLSVVSFDNNVDICTLLSPPLTSYEIALEQVTYLAACRLVSLIENGPTEQPPIAQSVAAERIDRHSIRRLDAAD